MAEVFSSEPLDISVTPADVLKAGHDERTAVLAEQALKRLPTVRLRSNFTDTFAFADGRSESPGKSLSRARIHLVGFEVPDLQHSVHDASAREVARVDYWWQAVTLAGESDGCGRTGWCRDPRPVDLAGSRGTDWAGCTLTTGPSAWAGQAGRR